MVGHSKAKLWLAGIALVAVTACSSIYRNHGYVPTEDELAEIVVGVDTRATVDDVIGAPSAGGLLEGGDYYYVRSRVKHIGMLEPQIIDRQVLAISFDGGDVVQNIERFGLEDGQVVPIARRVTNSSVEGKGFLRQLLGNLGSFNPGALLSNN
ncbi:outer membrane protein assembly factor BamE [Alisedimentitalea sp. MJ-SS2]|uniref:outer membrane protein assembly factor BamE n=1 Tax=Aliisedimentitalea sp. MJ-SS2 TaxID=3049795 RepID=UPI00290B5DB9|nr:outer membrane protein assembly factor BamE [Alisedimentitalea sp. MJ-SS2]MDU8926806.1 outer membrane protein assembly factor BamE [Alisedimentitalea sp. MJ-SS2]